MDCKQSKNVLLIGLAGMALLPFAVHSTRPADFSRSTTMEHEKVVEKIISKSLIGSGGCLFFDGAKLRCGYGSIKINSKSIQVRRFSYQVFNGEIPIGTDVLHKCDNPSCWNPNHLFLGTDIDNARDKMSKGRSPDFNGSKNPRAKITESQARLIHDSSVFTINELASIYNLSSTAIRYIKTEKNWKCLWEQKRDLPLRPASLTPTTFHNMMLNI